MNLAKFDGLVVLMLENRSLDHMLGYLRPGVDETTSEVGEWLLNVESLKACDRVRISMDMELPEPGNR